MGRKNTKNARFDLLPPDSLWLVAQVYGAGCEKYEPRNWESGYAWSKSYAALQRHLSLFWAGEDIDPESKMPHLAHATWHCLALLTFLNRGMDFNDDRSYLELADTYAANVYSMQAEEQIDKDEQ